MIETQQLARYRDILKPELLPEDPSQADIFLLTQVGALQLLIEDGGEAAIQILRQTVLRASCEAIHLRAANGLARLAKQGSAPAIDALFELSIASANRYARQEIIEHSLAHPDAGQQSAFLLISAQIQSLQAHDPNLQHLTAYFLRAEQDARTLLLQAAASARLHHWAALAACVSGPTPAAFDQLVNQYAAMTGPERTLTVQTLAQIAGPANPLAQDAVCQLYLRWDAEPACQLALQQGWAPADPTDRALFYFISGQWAPYETLDFDRRLIRSGYERASSVLKKKILAQSRYSGQIDWLQNAPGISKTRSISDLQDADWAAAFQALFKKADYASLWVLVQTAPPWWALEGVRLLKKAAWQPQSSEEKELLLRLTDLAHKCTLSALASLRPDQSHWLDGEVISATFTPSGQSLALGTADNRILFATHSDNTWEKSIFYPPTPQQNVLLLTQDGAYLAAANPDQSIRIYLLPEGKLIKTLSGHSNLVRAIVLSQDERTLFSAGFDGVVNRWRFPTGGQEPIYQSGSEIYALAATRRGDVLIGDGQGEIHIWNADARGTLRTLKGHSGAITSLSTSTGELAASYGTDHNICIWNIFSGKELNRIQISNDLEKFGEICLTSDERYILSAGARGAVHIWGVSNGQKILTLGGESDLKRIVALRAHSSLRQITAVSAAGNIYQYSTQTLAWALSPTDHPDRPSIDEIDRRLEQMHSPAGEIYWLHFIREQLLWRQRYDILLGAPLTLSAGEFDIQINPIT